MHGVIHCLQPAACVQGYRKQAVVDYISSPRGLNGYHFSRHTTDKQKSTVTF